MNASKYSSKRVRIFSSSLLLILLLSSCTWQIANNPPSLSTSIPSTATTQIENTDVLTKISWLKNNAIALKSILPANEDFSDLQPLKQIIGKKRIVMLGEASHGDGNTFLAKTRLIKFLHQEMGFDVLAFESGFYDCRKAQELIQAGQDVNLTFKQSILPIWSESSQVQPLVDYIELTQKSKQPLILAGFDNQFTGEISRTYLLNDLTALLNQYPEIMFGAQERDDLLNQTTRLIAGAPAPSSDELQNYLDEIEKLKQNLEKIAQQDNIEVAFWVQFLESLGVQAKFTFYVAPATSQYLHAHPELYSLRDMQMGNNLIWLANKNYPDKKIIVWAATYHIARNLGSVLSNNEVIQFQHENVTTMGDIAWKALGDQIYSLGFTAYNGSFGSVFETTQNLNPPSENSFEDMMYKTNLDYAIVDLRQPATGGEWLQGKIISRPLGYQEEIASWSKVLDGLMFIKEMMPSTR